MSNCTCPIDEENGDIDTNTILLIIDLVVTTISATILGMRCKLKKSNVGFMASCRPTNSTPSPASSNSSPPKELTDITVDDKT